MKKLYHISQEKIMEKFCKISNEYMAPAREYMFAYNLYYGFGKSEDKMRRQVEEDFFYDIDKANQEKEKIDVVYALTNKYLLNDCTVQLDKTLVYDNMDDESCDVMKKFIADNFATNQKLYDVLMKILHEAYYFLNKPFWGDEQPRVDDFDMLAMILAPFMAKMGVDIGRITKENPDDEDMYFYMNKDFKSVLEEYNQKCYDDESLNLYSVHRKHADLENPLLILDDTLARCDRLATGKIIVPEDIVYIGNCAFDSCDKVVEVCLLDSTVCLEYGCFYNCQSLEKIVLPKSIKFLNKEVFDSCTSLKKIEIPYEVEELPMGIFKGCKNLCELKYSKITFLGNESFWGTGFKTFTIPEGVKALYDYVFYDCENLETIYLPSTIKTIGERALAECPHLRQIIFNGTAEEWNAIEKDESWLLASDLAVVTFKTK